MNNTLAEIIGILCLIYLDDIIIYRKNLQDHDNKLREVFKDSSSTSHSLSIIWGQPFQRLKINKSKIQPDKCEFLRRQYLYLRHIIINTGIRLDPKKIQVVFNFPASTTVNGIK